MGRISFHVRTTVRGWHGGAFCFMFADFPKVKGKSFMRLGQGSVWLAAALMVGCGGIPADATDAEGKVATGGALVLESADGIWGGDLLRRDDGTIWVAAALHVDNKLGMWKIDADRREAGAPLLGETGYHPDGVAAWDGSSVAVAVEGIKRLQLWRLIDDRLLKEADLPSPFGARNVLAADLDADGKRDIVLAPYAGDELAVLWGEGGFSFAKPQMLKGGASGWHPVAVDIDGDGDLDLLWAELDTHVVRLARNDGGRSFTMRELRKVAGVTARQLAVGDVNRDGILDIVVAVEIGDSEVLLGQADGSYVVANIPPRSLGYVGAAIDADGTIALSEENVVTLYRWSESGWTRRELPVAGMPTPIAFGRVDKDAQDDLIVYHSAGKGGVRIFFGPVWDKATPLEAVQRAVGK